MDHPVEVSIEQNAIYNASELIVRDETFWLPESHHLQGPRWELETMGA